ncbi:MAG: N-acetylmannosamine-6-phosphate 2-epimerase [Xylanivirga thermophila]|jgi:N-acylglucosamine-6-phosphate 2-epimerase|uniref:N-acetylmannosamine-6-phosphate 2-epimerase n=1 Tax=Xylanivirga thermophila TaxID=2496273 RepID=UPI0039F58C7E
MEKDEFLNNVYKGLIVSCQALNTEPLYGSEIMAKMATAAKMGGAVAIRANYAQDIKAIKKVVNLPVIGLVKRDYDDSDAYITPTLKEVKEVVEAGAEVVAIDATDVLKPGGKTTAQLIKEIKENFDIMILADISTYEEAVKAQEAGADFVSTTMSGYTPYSPQLEGPDFKLMARLSQDLVIPVFGEGRIWTPEEAVKALELGVHAVIVGTAITRPREITQRFAKAVASVSNKE